MKKIILIFIALLLTGCKTEVNINISENGVSENIKIYDLKENVFESGSIKEEVNNNIVYFEHDYQHYDIEEFEANGFVGKNYKFTSDLSLLGSSISRLTTCYEKIEVKNNAYTYSINTSNEYRCGYIFGGNDVILNISSDFNVKSSNADKVDGNVLTWYINEENYKNKKIKLVYDLSKDNYDAIKDNSNDNKEVFEESEDFDTNINNDQVDDNILNKENNIILYIFIILGIGLVILGIVIFVKVRNSNK